MKIYQNAHLKTYSQAAAFLGRVLYELSGSFIQIGLEQMCSDREVSKHKIINMAIFDQATKSSALFQHSKTILLNMDNKAIYGLLRSPAFISGGNKKTIFQAVEDPSVLKRAIFLDIDSPSLLSPLFEIVINSLLFFTMTLGDKPVRYNYLSEAYLKALSLAMILPELSNIISRESFKEYLENSRKWGIFKIKGSGRRTARLLANIINNSESDLSAFLLKGSILKYFFQEQRILHTICYLNLKEDHKFIYPFKNLVTIEEIWTLGIDFGINFKINAAILNIPGSMITVQQDYLAVLGKSRKSISLNGQVIKDHRLRLSSEAENCIIIAPQIFPNDEGERRLEVLAKLFNENDPLKFFALVIYQSSLIKVQYFSLDFVAKPRLFSKTYPVPSSEFLQRLGAKNIVDLGVLMYHRYSDNFVGEGSEITESEKSEFFFHPSLEKIMKENAFLDGSRLKIQSLLEDPQKLFSVMERAMTSVTLNEFKWKLERAIDIFFLLCLVRKRTQFCSALVYIRVLELLLYPELKEFLGDEFRILTEEDSIWHVPLDIEYKDKNVGNYFEASPKIPPPSKFDLKNIQSTFLTREKAQRLANVINKIENAVEFLFSKKYILEMFLWNENEHVFREELSANLRPFSQYYYSHIGIY
jgi:hypothetical protein